MALSEKDRLVLIKGGVVLGLLTVYFLGVEPLWGWYDGLVAEHGRRAAAVARAMTDNNKAEYYRELVTECEAKAGELSSPKPYSEQITTVSDEVIAAAQKNGLQLKEITPAAAANWSEDPSLQRAAILIDGEAGFESMFKFIAALYRIESVLSVEQMDLTGDPKKPGKLAVKMTASFLVKAPESSDWSW